MSRAEGLTAGTSLSNEETKMTGLGAGCLRTDAQTRIRELAGHTSEGTREGTSQATGSRSTSK
jgi:hypothetical protein